MGTLCLFDTAVMGTVYTSQLLSVLVLEAGASIGPIFCLRAVRISNLRGSETVQVQVKRELVWATECLTDGATRRGRNPTGRSYR